MFTRGPALIAQSAAALAAAAPGRFSLGLGASSPAIVEQWNGLAFDRPLQRTRDVLRFVKAALAGELVDGSFDSFTVHRFRLEQPPPEPVPVLLAALRPRMLALAGREADGVILNWLAATDVAAVPGRAGQPGQHGGGPDLPLPDRGRRLCPDGGQAADRGIPDGAAPTPSSTAGWDGPSSWASCGSCGRPAIARRRWPASRTRWPTRWCCTAARPAAGSRCATTSGPACRLPILAVLPTPEVTDAAGLGRLLAALGPTATARPKPPRAEVVR